MLQAGLRRAVARVLLPAVARALQPLLRPVRVLGQRHLHRPDQPRLKLRRELADLVRSLPSLSVVTCANNTYTVQVILLRYPRLSSGLASPEARLRKHLIQHFSSKCIF